VSKTPVNVVLCDSCTHSDSLHGFNTQAVDTDSESGYMFESYKTMYTGDFDTMLVLQYKDCCAGPDSACNGYGGTLRRVSEGGFVNKLPFVLPPWGARQVEPRSRRAPLAVSRDPGARRGRVRSCCAHSGSDH